MDDQSDDDYCLDGYFGLCYRLFKETQCIINDVVDNENDDSNNDDDEYADDEINVRKLETLDEDKMRCHILDCLAALHRVQREKRTRRISSGDKEYESAKRRVFSSAVTIVMEFEESVIADQHDLRSLLPCFPDKEKMTDGRSWLPLHLAIVLGDKVREEDVYTLHANDPLAMQRYSHPKLEEAFVGRFLPCHLLCMQTHPNMSLVRNLSMRDMKAFTMLVCCGEYYTDGLNTLQLAAQYSESVELLKNLLQIDQSMAKVVDHDCDGSINKRSFTSLGFLCGRPHSIIFKKMIECLLEANSSIEVMRDSLVSYFRFYDGRSKHPDIKVMLIFIESLLDANSAFATYIDSSGNNILHWVCHYLEGELGVAVLSLLFKRFNDEVGGWSMVKNNSGHLPIHLAAEYSTLNVVELLLELNPELFYEKTRDGLNLLHMVLNDDRLEKAPANAKVQYLCDHHPDLLQMVDNRGRIPISLLSHCDLKSIKIMCEKDNTIVKHVCHSQDIDLDRKLPLHYHLIYGISPFFSNVSNRADCFRYLLGLYPAAAGIKDGRNRSPYDYAVGYLDVYFVRLLLNADHAIEPEGRRHLNYAARREAMFLAFRALSSNYNPSIWVKLRYESRDSLVHTISYL
jgi:hypothetical protein